MERLFLVMRRRDLAEANRRTSKLRWYQSLPLVLSLAFLVLLPSELFSVVFAIKRAHWERQLDRRIPQLVYTTEVYVVACRNAEKSPDVARTVATSRAKRLAAEYGIRPVPKLVLDRLEQQIQKHYERPPAPDNQPWLWYSCKP